VNKLVIVTGGSGKVGRFVVRHLLQAGYVVRNVDCRVPEDDLGCPTVIADLLDERQVRSALLNADAVVHLAAHPTTGQRPESVTFGENTRIAYHVLAAASEQEVPRVVCMSTMAVIYYPHPEWYPFEPRYLPVDEEHPVTYRNAYSLSKQAGELIADMVARQGRTLPVSLRPPWIVMPGEIQARGLLNPWKLQEGLAGLWSYIDVRDVARACQAAIEADLTRHEVFNLTAPDTCAPLPTLELIHKNWSALQDLRGHLRGGPRGSQSSYCPLIDDHKAERLLNFRPLYSARTALSGGS
jgi:nucleoside-diphosphate-sugar epimerase